MWIMVGPSSKSIIKELGIDPDYTNFLKATPILLGSILRIPVGILSDRFGARILFPIMILIASAGALLMSFSGSFSALMTGAFLMGVIGTTFAVGVQSVSSWSPASKQGYALGIFGAGNAGTTVTLLAMPYLLSSLGWRTTYQIYAVILIVVAAIYFAFMSDAPKKGDTPTFSKLIAPIKEPTVLLFGFYYMASFGVFVASTLLISDIYVDGFSISAKTAGLLGCTFTLVASFSRIPGGKFSDTIGAKKTLRYSLLFIVLFLLPVAIGLPLIVTAILVFLSATCMLFLFSARE